MTIKGYKSFRNNNGVLTTQFDTTMEVGKLYKVESPIKWNNNGFHFCSNIEDTFRYMSSFNDNISITEVEGSGEIIIYDDDYNGYYDMRASSQIRILKVLSRNEVIKKVISSGDIAIGKMIECAKLTQEEINLLANRNYYLNRKLRYYQLGDLDAFNRN